MGNNNNTSSSNTIDSLFRWVINNKYLRDIIFQCVSDIHRRGDEGTIKGSQLHATPFIILLKYTGRNLPMFRHLYDPVRELLPKEATLKILDSAYQKGLFNVIIYLEERLKEIHKYCDIREPLDKVMVAWKLGDIDLINHIHNLYLKANGKEFQYNIPDVLPSIFHSLALNSECSKRDLAIDLALQLIAKSSSKGDWRVWGDIYVLANQYYYVELAKLALKHSTYSIDKGIYLEKACTWGRVDIIKYHLDKFGSNITPIAMENAINSGSIELINILIQSFLKQKGITKNQLGAVIYPRYLLISISQGRLDMLKYLIEDIGYLIPLDSLLLARAVKSGHLDIVNYLIGNTKEWVESKRLTGNKAKKWEVLKLHKSLLTIDYVEYLLEKSDIIQVELSIIYRVIKANRIELFKYILGSKEVLNKFTNILLDRVLASISRLGRLEMLEEFHRLFPEVMSCRSGFPLRLAMQNCHIEIVKYFTMVCPLEKERINSDWLDKNVFDSEMLEFLIHGYPELRTMYIELFEHGRLDLITFIFDYVSKTHPEQVSKLLTLSHLTSAMSQGNGEVVEWIINNLSKLGQFPQSNWVVPEYMMKSAFRANDLVMIKSMLASKSSIFQFGINMMEDVIISGSIELLQLMYSQFPSFMSSKDVLVASKWGKTETLEYLLKNHGSLFTVDCLPIASEYGHLDRVKMIIKHFINCGSKEKLPVVESFHIAVKKGHYRVSDYLLNFIQSHDKDTSFSISNHSNHSIQILLKYKNI